MTPLEDCLRYLKQNPVMREIIGELIRRQEETTSEKDSAAFHLIDESSESNAEIQRWMDEFQPPQPIN